MINDWHKLVKKYREAGLNYSDLSKAQKVELSKIQPSRFTRKQKREALIGAGENGSGVGQPLGPDYENKLAEIVETSLSNWRIGAATNQHTGEIEENWKRRVERLNDEMREQFYKNLERYQEHATFFRQKHKMRPFSWELETEDRIRQYLKAKAWQLPKLRKIEPPKDKNSAPSVQLTVEQILDDETYYADENQFSNRKESDPPVKPGQHFNQRHQLKEYAVERSSPPTQRAMDVLKQFDETGRAEAPERDYEKWRADHQAWKDEMPEPQKPTREAEPLETIISEVADKYRHLFK